MIDLASANLCFMAARAARPLLPYVTLKSFNACTFSRVVPKRSRATKFAPAFFMSIKICEAWWPRVRWGGRSRSAMRFSALHTLGNDSGLHTPHKKHGSMLTHYSTYQSHEWGRNFGAPLVRILLIQTLHLSEAFSKALSIALVFVRSTHY